MAGAYHKHLMELALKQTYQDTCNCIKSPIKLEFEKRQQVPISGQWAGESQACSEWLSACGTGDGDDNGVDYNEGMKMMENEEWRRVRQRSL